MVKILLVHRRVRRRLTAADREGWRWRWNVVHEEFALVAMEEIGRHVEAKIDHVKELELQDVQFRRGDATNSSIIGVVIVGVVKEFGSDHDTSDQQAMDIEGREKEAGIFLNDAIQIDDGQDEAFRAAVGIFHEPFQIGLDCD